MALALLTPHPYHTSLSKRVFDVVAATTLLLLTLPILVVASLWVLVLDGQPVVFLQKRRGKQHTVFTLIKIRTMVKNAENLKKKLLHRNQAPLPMFKIFDDPRFIQGGRFLSATGIDELPQLLNIIKGEMSLVGPRPLPVLEAAKLPKNWGFRFSVKPGLFSHWSASRDRHTSLKHWRELELQTVSEGSVFSDTLLVLRIISTSVWTLLRHIFDSRA